MPGRWSPEKRRPSIFWLLAAIARPLMGILTRFEYKGSLPQTGAFILAPNHYSDFDPLLVGVTVWDLGRLPRFLAKASLFKVPVVGMLLRRSGQIPVERGARSGNRDSVRAAKQLVHNEQGVVIYPEGTLTRQPEYWPMRGKHGAVRLAIQAGLPIIPMAQWGGNALMQGHSSKFTFRFRTPIKVAIGEPIDMTPFADRASSAAAMTEATNLVMREIAKLLEGLRGEPAPAELWDPKEHGQTEFGRHRPSGVDGSE